MSFWPPARATIVKALQLVGQKVGGKDRRKQVVWCDGSQVASPRKHTLQPNPSIVPVRPTRRVPQFEAAPGAVILIGRSVVWQIHACAASLTAWVLRLLFACPFGRPGRPDPQIDDLRSVKKSYTKKPRCKTWRPLKAANKFGRLFGWWRAPGFFVYDFLTDRKSSILGVWAVPGGRETLQKKGFNGALKKRPGGLNKKKPGGLKKGPAA